MKLSKSNREKQIDDFLKQLETQDEYESQLKKQIELFYKEYSEELEDYQYIKSINEFNNIKKGGYVRYFNLNNEIKWGGILIKKIKNNDMDLMVLCNSNCNRFIVSFQKNHIFYKKHQTSADKTRKIFLSALDKYTDYNDN